MPAGEEAPQPNSVLTQRRRDGASETPPARFRPRMHSNSLAAASCIRATLLEKIDDLPFPPLSGQIVIRGFSGTAGLAVQSGSGGALGGYYYKPAAIGDGAGANRSSRGLRCHLGRWLRFGRHRRHRCGANRRPPNRRGRRDSACSDPSDRGVAPKRRNAERESC